MKFETHTLKNGLKVLFAHDPNAQSVTVMTMTGSGSRYESKDENGMAHFLEHMVFKGTKKRPTAKDIAEELDGVGGTFNAFTSKDHTAYYAKVAARHFQTAFDVITDIFLHPTFVASEIKREKGTIIEEMHMYQDMPMRSVLDDADETIFGKNDALGRTIIGPEKNIRAFTRKDFVTYFNRNYVAGNSAICIAGAFSKTQALKLVRKAFSDMRIGDIPKHTLYEHTQDMPRVAIQYKKTDQTHMVIAVPSVPIGSKKEAVAEVLSAILGGGMSSRLFTQVRERRGLAYYVKAEQDSYDDTGVLYARAGVTNETASKALSVILKEITKMKKIVVAPKELKKAKEYSKGTTALSLETTDAQAVYMGYTALVRKSNETLEEYNKAIDAVTAKQVQELARELFVTSNLNVTIIGPHKDVDLFRILVTV